jgi:hypothetical protein
VRETYSIAIIAAVLEGNLSEVALEGGRGLLIRRLAAALRSPPG